MSEGVADHPAPKPTAAFDLSEPSAVDGSPPLATSALAAGLPIDLVFVAGRLRMTFAELQSLAPGQVLDLQRAVDGHIEVVAAGATLGRGELVTLDGRLGVRLLEVGAKASQAEASQAEASQAEASQAEASHAKASQASQPKASQAEAGQASQAKASQAKASQAKAGQASQAEASHAKAGQASQAEASQAKASQAKANQAKKGKAKEGGA